MDVQTWTCPTCHRTFQVMSTSEKLRLELVTHKAPDGKLCNPDKEQDQRT